jgi:hypothetical protein
MSEGEREGEEREEKGRRETEGPIPKLRHEEVVGVTLQ